MGIVSTAHSLWPVRRSAWRTWTCWDGTTAASRRQARGLARATCAAARARDSHAPRREAGAAASYILSRPFTLRLSQDIRHAEHPARQDGTCIIQMPMDCSVVSAAKCEHRRLHRGTLISRSGSARPMSCLRTGGRLRAVQRQAAWRSAGRCLAARGPCLRCKRCARCPASGSSRRPCRPLASPSSCNDHEDSFPMRRRDCHAVHVHLHRR